MTIMCCFNFVPGGLGTPSLILSETPCSTFRLLEAYKCKIQVMPISSYLGYLILGSSSISFFEIFPIVFSFASVDLQMFAKKVLLISSYFTICPGWRRRICGGGCAGYVVVLAQDMWWGKSKTKLTQPSWSWNWG